jgi:hypothetical protein
MMFVTTRHPTMVTVMVGLALSGLGMGFTMGTPVNYMMLANTDRKQSNSALATLSLVRSLGTAIAPAIMVGFIANAGMNVQGNIMAVLPQEISMPDLPYSQEVSSELAALSKDPQMKAALGQMDMPDLSGMKTVKINMNDAGNYKMPPELLALLQSSDVTTITANTKTMAETMFRTMEPGLTAKIQSGIGSGIDGIAAGEKGMKAAGAPDSAIKGMDMLSAQMKAMKDGVPQALDTALQNYLKAIDARSTDIENEFQRTLNEGFYNIYLMTVIAAAIAVITALLYDKKRELG